jgi:hypothetical protein
MPAHNQRFTDKVAFVVEDVHRRVDPPEAQGLLDERLVRQAVPAARLPPRRQPHARCGGVVRRQPCTPRREVPWMVDRVTELPSPDAATPMTAPLEAMRSSSPTLSRTGTPSAPRRCLTPILRLTPVERHPCWPGPLPTHATVKWVRSAQRRRTPRTSRAWLPSCLTRRTRTAQRVTYRHFGDGDRRVERVVLGRVAWDARAPASESVSVDRLRSRRAARGRLVSMEARYSAGGP